MYNHRCSLTAKIFVLEEKQLDIHLNGKDLMTMQKLKCMATFHARELMNKSCPEKVGEEELTLGDLMIQIMNDPTFGEWDFIKTETPDHPGQYSYGAIFYCECNDGFICYAWNKKRREIGMFVRPSKDFDIKDYIFVEDLLDKENSPFRKRKTRTPKKNTSEKKPK